MNIDNYYFNYEMKKILRKGFTLVELLIVIALIAILSVAVLATINPIEQSNKARDAKVQNDAAEVLNAYERYYTSTAHYPWMDVLGGQAITVDSFYAGRSIQVGFGLCGNAAAVATTDGCSAQNTPGKLIETQELKDSFLSKSYTRLVSDVSYNYQDELYAIKQDATLGNSIYVCFVPKAKANRNAPAGASWKLKALNFAGALNAELPVSIADATAQNKTDATYTALVSAGPSGGNDSLFRCVPE